jgi:hypothetical protein
VAEAAAETEMLAVTWPVEFVMTDIPRTVNKVINLVLQPLRSNVEGAEYCCPYQFCQYTRALAGFMRHEACFHIVQNHMTFYVHPVVARYGEFYRPDQFVFYPELENTDVTDRIMFLTRALVREKCQVVGCGNFAAGEHFAYIRISTPHWNHVLHCCVYCNYTARQLQTFKRHVADAHFAVEAMRMGSQQPSTSWEHHFYN